MEWTGTVCQIITVYTNSDLLLQTIMGAAPCEHTHEHKSPSNKLVRRCIQGNYLMLQLQFSHRHSFLVNNERIAALILHQRCSSLAFLPVAAAIFPTDLQDSANGPSFLSAKYLPPSAVIMARNGPLHNRNQHRLS